MLIIAYHLYTIVRFCFINNIFPLVHNTLNAKIEDDTLYYLLLFYSYHNK